MSKPKKVVRGTKVGIAVAKPMSNADEKIEAYRQLAARDEKIRSTVDTILQVLIDSRLRYKDVEQVLTLLQYRVSDTKENTILS